jgi:hypothetical protein
MGMIAICSNILIGYMTHRVRTEAMLLLALPFVVSVSFLLIADIDSPRSGLIHVRPQNMVALYDSIACALMEKIIPARSRQLELNGKSM